VRVRVRCDEGVAGELCLASPYGPSTRFTAGNAMGRNKIICGLADVTLVVCAESGSGGTWGGATEALRRGFGRVAVWTREGAGPGNAELVGRGATPVTTSTR
jgi:predicted Rossmann fold nucleotide-binding protein DprA/Smf involved in DNA uptake